MISSRQAVKVIVSLAGEQNVAVASHRPGTDGAAIGVRIGGALIYIEDAETARSFYRAWLSGARQARPLPLKADPTTVMPVAGVGEPVVMMEAADSPPAVARLKSVPGRPASLWVTLGRVVFDVRDHSALRSTLSAFRRADKLAATAFPPTCDEIAGEQAARAAARLFAAPAGSAGHEPKRAAHPRPAGRVQPLRTERSTSERAM